MAERAVAVRGMDSVYFLESWTNHSTPQLGQQPARSLCAQGCRGALDRGKPLVLRRGARRQLQTIDMAGAGAVACVWLAVFAALVVAQDCPSNSVAAQCAEACKCRANEPVLCSKMMI